jgi:hypothetical protein
VPWTNGCSTKTPLKQSTRCFDGTWFKDWRWWQTRRTILFAVNQKTLSSSWIALQKDTQPCLQDLSRWYTMKFLMLRAWLIPSVISTRRTTSDCGISRYDGYRYWRGRVLNLVFFKVVRSYSKFWQMIGRGTRLCPDVLVQINPKIILFWCLCQLWVFEVQKQGKETYQVIHQQIFESRMHLGRLLVETGEEGDIELSIHWEIFYTNR